MLRCLVFIRMADDHISRFSITLSDQAGKEILAKEIYDNSFAPINLNVAQGTYFLKIEFPEELILQNETLKLIVNWLLLGTALSRLHNLCIELIVNKSGFYVF